MAYEMLTIYIPKGWRFDFKLFKSCYNGPRQETKHINGNREKKNGFLGRVSSLRKILNSTPVKGCTFSY